MTLGEAPRQGAGQDVVIAVLTWNGLQTTRDCLRTLPALKGWPVPVIVVDNGSREPEGARLADEFGPPVTFVRLEPNRGVPGGYNAGLAEAARRGATHALLMNNDTLIVDDDMLVLLTRSAEPGVAAVAPLTVERDALTTYSAGGELSWWTGLSRHRKVPLRADRAYEARWVDGPCILVSLEAVEAIGGFDDAYVTYWEDVDWCVRARRAGFRILVEPRARVVHLRGGSNPSRTAETMHLRNRILFMRRHGSLLQNIVSGVFFLSIHVPVFIARRIGGRGGLRAATKVVVEAIWWNVADAWAARAWRKQSPVAPLDRG